MALPDCMMPDGADPCLAYQELRAQLAAAQAEHERLREAAQLMMRYFESGNGVPVYRATILGNCEAVIQLRAALAKEPPR